MKTELAYTEGGDPFIDGRQDLSVHWAQQREKSAGGWLGVNFGIVLIDNKVKKSPKPNVSFKGTSNVVVPANPLSLTRRCCLPSCAIFCAKMVSIRL